MRSRAGAAAANRLKPAFAVATALLLLLLGFFAYSLADGQAQQRDDIKKRFNDRARTAATVNEALFSLATSSVKANDAELFGGPKVNQEALVQRTQVQQQIYGAIVSADGEVLAKAGDVPNDVANNDLVKAALKSKSVVYSSLMSAGSKGAALESAVAFPTKDGLRVDVTGSRADALSQFLNSFLSKLPSVADAKSYVIDNANKVIATPGAKSRAGVPLEDKELDAAVSEKSSGSYDGGRYFTSSTISGTPWRIVLSAADKNLYAAVETTVPWIIFAAFVLVSLGGMLLLWRVLIANAELQRADLSRQHALEINDNVVQRLVLAKYALDRGATETSQQKLSETLRETQQLVTSLLEEREIGPGSLRREAPAETEGRPTPSTPDSPEVKQ